MNEGGSENATETLAVHDSAATAVVISLGAGGPGIGRRAARPHRTKNRGIRRARDDARGGASSRAPRPGRFRADQREMPRRPPRELDSGPNSGFTLRATAFANGPGVHERNSPDSGVGHWRDDFYFYVGGCRFTEVATRRESGRAVQFGERTALLLSGRVYSGKRVLPGFL